MTTENLIDAFGQIDDTIFAETENGLADRFEEQAEPVIFSAAEKKQRMIRPYFTAAAVLALVIALPLLVTYFANNTPADIEPPYNSGDSFTESVEGTVGTEPAETVGENEEKTGEEPCLTEMSIEDIIAASDCILRAEFISSEDSGDRYNYTFSKIETIKDNTGGAFGDKFELSLNKNGDDRQMFTEGEYILPLTYFDSVYFDSPYCDVICDTVISCGGGIIKSIFVNGSAVEMSEELITVDDFTQYANSVEDRSSSLSGGYITSTLLSDIIEQSDYIVKAVIDHEPLRSGEDRGMYTCNLVQCYKGEVEETFEAVFMYDSVEVGKEYYFFLTKPDANSVFYIVSSKNSIYSSDDTNVTDMLNRSSFVFLEGESIPYDMLVDFNSEFDYSESGDPDMIALLSGLPAEITDLYRQCSTFFPLIFYGAVPFAEAAPREYSGTLCEMYMGNPVEYYQTGYNYDSFSQAVFNVFTEERAQKITDRFKVYNGGLWTRDTGWGGPSVYFAEYEISSLTDTEIVITRTEYYCSSGYETFDPDKKDEYEKNDYECKFVLTDKGWRAEKFFELDLLLDYYGNNYADMLNEDSDVTPETAAENPVVYIDGKEYTLTGEPMTADMLADYELEKYHGLDECGYQSMTDFLDGLNCPYKEELKDLYRRAHVISFYEGSCGTDNIPWESVITVPESRARLESDGDGTFFETGFTYDSFYNNYLDIFTKKTAERIFEFYPWFLSYNGELWIIGVSGGSFYTQLPYEEYEVVKQTDVDITIRRTLYFYDWVSAGEECEYDPEKKDLYTKQHSDCKFVFTDDGWRIEEFFGFLKNVSS